MKTITTKKALETEGETSNDEQFMKKAIELSRLAVEHGNEPFGAVLVKNGELENILGNEGCNCSKIVFDNSFWKPEVNAGVLKDEAIAVLKDYFDKHEKG